MFLFALVLRLSQLVVYLVAIANLVYVLINKESHAGMVHFGRSMAIYLQQIASFLTFDTEQLPFPFKPWP